MVQSQTDPVRVAIITARDSAEFREQVMEYCRANWHPDFTCPQLFALPATESEFAVRVANWIARVAAQLGKVAPVIHPGGKSPLQSARCMHRIGVTELLLDPDPAQVDQLFAFGLWTRLAPRTRRLWMRISPQLATDIAINAGDANPVMSVLVGRWRGVNLAIISQDVIAAEVAARAFRMIAEPAGETGITPWQEPVVQAAIERHLGARSGSELVLAPMICLPSDDSAYDSIHAILLETAALLDTTVQAVAF